MICPGCQKEGKEDTIVLSTKSHFAKGVQLPVIRRTRKCICGAKWSTWEINKQAITDLIKENEKLKVYKTKEKKHELYLQQVQKQRSELSDLLLQCVARNKGLV